MTTKIFCDSCSKEIPKKIDWWTIPALGKAEALRLIVMGDPPVNKPDICKHCIIDAFKKLDDRAMVMPATGVPREPTEAMICAGVEFGTTPEVHVCGEQAKRIWRRMYDEAVRHLEPAAPIAPTLPHLATLEMVSSVNRSCVVNVSNEWLQDVWRQMYDAATNKTGVDPKPEALAEASPMTATELRRQNKEYLDDAKAAQDANLPIGTTRLGRVWVPICPTEQQFDRAQHDANIMIGRSAFQRLWTAILAVVSKQ